ncbi:hypothetical protein FRZ44_33900 [Hypericibacter terrae]|uniref:HNH nuclease domain-containing protein n=1 Tax=Hypericibacter terrae TaxID=2602015 RepID=A0A5J6MT72_9PROT|nr:HNH endonuclease [Hypericibacter terrae]QEX18086.1 hypothetical protein FRZ44_33900 [Hypericibacter terrae]
MTLAAFDRIRLEKAAVDEGFGIARGEHDGWLAFESLGAPAALRLTTAAGQYLVATDHAGVVADLARRWSRWPVDAVPPSPVGFQTFVVDDTAPLHDLVRDIWRLARSLPEAPLRRFESETRNLPRSTEAERLVIQRVGQDVYRGALMDYWRGCCAITGLAVPELLRASHAKPWAKCESDAERLDVYNGLLLAAHLDAAFDAGLIGVAVDGMVLVSERLDEAARVVLGLHVPAAVKALVPSHGPYLDWHRLHVFR